MHHRSHHLHPVGGGGVGFPACITGHLSRGSASRGLCIQGGGSLHPVGSASRGRGSAYEGGGWSAYSEVGQTPPLAKLGKQTLHILLECFLVLSCDQSYRAPLLFECSDNFS